MEKLEAFFKKESSVGIMLILATVLAMIFANTALSTIYDNLIDMPVVVKLGTFGVEKPLLLWINDGLMAIFFFMVGLEIKHEVVDGNLKDIKKVLLPAIAAIGGVLFPALIYTSFNYNNEVTMSGWAIPTATDIAFALGILSLLGSRVPVGLKIFLLALAIIDDLAAIIIIALFYTSSLSTTSLVIAAVMITILSILNLSNNKNTTLYVILGTCLWLAVLKSGVHATLAGVALGLLIPLKDNSHNFHSMEESLKVPVNFIILPIFAFVNTGVGFGGMAFSDLYDSVTLGIALGLFFGKQIGVFLFAKLAVMFRLGTLPDGVNWSHIYGVAVLSGIGFTMSLFIGSLAFEDNMAEGVKLADKRLGILLGSIASGIVGFWILKRVLREKTGGRK